MTLNLEVLLLYLTQGYNDWEMLRLMQEVIHQGERLHEFPDALRLEDDQVWDENPVRQLGTK